MAGAGASSAAVAALLAKQREEEETEGYRGMETSIGWEFKILRANLPAFRDPLVLKRACEEEAPAGWTMFEKLDDSRIRFRRLTSAKAGDAGLSIDPYRSQFGISTVRYTLILLGAVFLATALILAIVFVAINYFSKH